MAVDGVSAGDSAWVLASTAVVLLMTPGLAFFYGGLVKGSSVLNTMMMVIINMGLVSMVWLLVGFSLAFGESGTPWIGDLDFAGLGNLHATVWPGTALPSLVFVAFQMTFAIIGSAIISGAIVERIAFRAFIAFSVLWSVLVYAPVAHWVWGPKGWILELGAKDFAGGTVVHEITGISAVVLAKLLGPRRVQAGHEAHNVPFVILGASLLWFGWSGFNGGSALAADEMAALALINTYLSAGASLLVWVLIEKSVDGHASAVGCVTGAILGLVTITPSAGFVTPLGSAAIGVLGCLMVFPFFRWNHKWVDDSLDCFPCHGAGGLVGTLLTGVFATEGGLLYGGSFDLLWKQVVAAFSTMAFAAVMTTLIYYLLSLVLTMRVSDEAEAMGLDAAVHGQEAYRRSERLVTSVHTEKSECSRNDDSDASTEDDCHTEV